MKLRDAISKSIRKYYDGVLPERAIEASDEEFIWTLEAFDKLKEAKNEKSK